MNTGSAGCCQRPGASKGFFKLIVPCGIADKGVTSLAARLGKLPPITEVEDRFVDRFCEVFERTVAAPH